VQDIYAFDVGDFGKIGLLRHMHRRTDLRLGVLWYKTHLGSAGADGKHVGYLKQRRYRTCDPELWDEMTRRFDPANRRISALCPLFPADTLFHETPVPNDRREAWFENAKAIAGQAEVVFCDPDMGVIFDGACRSAAHIGLAEISSLFAAGHSLVVYHHLNRSDKHDAQIESAVNRFQREMSGLAAARGAWFRRGSSRVFFILAQEKHAEGLMKALEEIESTAWCRDGHFVIVPSAMAGNMTATLAADRTTSVAVPRVKFRFENSSLESPYRRRPQR
jgi:hypothetical protein